VSAAVILLVDDEPSIQRATGALLRSRGYTVIVAGTGREALDSFERDRPGLVILDLGLPDMDGIEVCRQVRRRADVPILVLSVRDAERAKVGALDAGADDYVTKPFGAEELLARVRAGLRRYAGRERARHGQLQSGAFVIDFDRRRVSREQEEIHLTPKEFDLLALLASHGGGVVTRGTIAKAIWGLSGTGQQEHLRVLVGQLRKKLERDPSRPRYVLTEPWVGYRLAGEVPERPSSR
jgi:two-component system KDP operon response regulator KdpE